MKRISYFKKIIVLAGICIFCSCNGYEYHTITIAIDDDCTLEQQTAAYEIINKRLSIWEINEKTDLVDGKFDLTYRVGKQSNSNTDSLWTQILTQRGEIFIAEAYLNTDIEWALDKVYEKLFWLIENTDHKPLWRKYSLFQNGVRSGVPELINVPLQQVPFIDSIFNSCKHFFPEDISFVWTAKKKEGLFGLLAIKPTRLFPLNPNTVKSCKIDYHKYKHDGILFDYQEISIELEEDYIGKWRRMTRNNIDKNLAIVMDGKVCSYPTVNSEIPNGRLTISGNFENNELWLIQLVILGGVLDCKAQIVNKEDK